MGHLEVHVQLNLGCCTMMVPVSIEQLNEFEETPHSLYVTVWTLTPWLASP